jgi:hypothetical protein
MVIIKELKKELRIQRKERFVRRFIGIFEVIFAFVGAPFELLFKLNPMVLMFKVLDQEPIDLTIDSFDLIDDARTDFDYARDASEYAKGIKQEIRKLKQENKKRAITSAIEKHEEHNVVAEYTKTLFTKINNLDFKKQKAFILKIKKVLTEYINTSLKLLKANQDITPLNELTIKKLAIIEEAIDKVLNINTQVKEESEEQTLTKKVSK